MASVGRLSIEVDVNTNAAARGLDNLDNSIRDVDDSADGLRQRFMELAASIGAGAFVSKLVSVQRQFDVLNASLITMTGSAADAAAEMEWIKRFAATTPYDLAQVVGAFTKLKSLGLDPSEAALRSYGNTAAAMGKDLNDFIEAVADASTGEFERLKEFGIKSSKEGDKIRFTFQGVTTEISDSADQITDYLRKIGDVNFGTAMSERAKTLDGAISNLADSWDGLFLTIMKSGVGDAIKSQVDTASSALSGLSATIENNKETLGILLSATAGAGLAASLPRIAAGLVAVRAAFAAMAAIAIANPAVLALLVGGAILGGVAGYNNRIRSTRELREELDQVRAARERLIDQEGALASTSGFDAQIDKLQQALDTAKQLELANVPSLLTNQSPAESRRLGMTAPTAVSATPVDPAAAKAAQQAADEAKKRAEEVEAFFAGVSDQARQREIDGLNEFLIGLKTREDARMQAAMSERELAEQKYATELEQLTAAKEAGLLIEQDYTDRLLQLRMDRDTAIMDADMAMLDHERQIADEQFELKKRAAEAERLLQERNTNAMIGLLNLLGSKNKIFAVAAIALQTKTAYTQNKIATALAANLAFASQLTPGDPTSYARAVAAKASALALGASTGAMILASGALQAAGAVSSGSSSSASLNTTTSPATSRAATNSTSQTVMPESNQVITIQGVGTGDLFSGDAVRSLIEKLADAQRNGARVVIA